ncbi:MAG: hypothetical protein QM702_00115 [Rubrivivax sp.]
MKRYLVPAAVLILAIVGYQARAGATRPGDYIAFGFLGWWLVCWYSALILLDRAWRPYAEHLAELRMQAAEDARRRTQRRLWSTR